MNLNGELDELDTVAGASVSLGEIDREVRAHAAALKSLHGALEAVTATTAPLRDRLSSLVRITVLLASAQSTCRAAASALAQGAPSRELREELVIELSRVADEARFLLATGEVQG